MNTAHPAIAAPEQGAGRVQAATARATPVNVVSLVQTYLLWSLGQSADAWVYQNVALNSNTPAQTLMSPMVDDGGPIPNPEPGTIVMLGFGLGLLGVRDKNVGHHAADERSAQ